MYIEQLVEAVAEEIRKKFATEVHDVVANMEPFFIGWVDLGHEKPVIVVSEGSEQYTQEAVGAVTVRYSVIVSIQTKIEGKKRAEMIRLRNLSQRILRHFMNNKMVENYQSQTDAIARVNGVEQGWDVDMLITNGNFVVAYEIPFQGREWIE